MSDFNFRLELLSGSIVEESAGGGLVDGETVEDDAAVVGELVGGTAVAGVEFVVGVVERFVGEGLAAGEGLTGGVAEVAGEGLAGWVVGISLVLVVS